MLFAATSLQPAAMGEHAAQAKSLVWVKSGHFFEFDGCPLYPRKRTSPLKVRRQIVVHLPFPICTS